jgi:phospholipase C
VSDADLTRKEFLERTAYTAGLAGMASTLPVSVLLSEAADAEARRARLPSPRNVPIDHFVILMMENRSFDHYFGWVPNADATQNVSYRNPQGQSVPTRHAGTLGGAKWQGCGHPDPGHGWDSGRAQLTGGFLDAESGNDEFALCYYNRGELGFIHEAARQYTLYDRYFTSLLTSTWPNRYYKWSGQSGGVINNTPPVATAGHHWETIFDRALANNLSARYYASDLPFAAVWGTRGISWTNPVERFYSDCAAGTLPNISIVDPPFRDGGGGDGLSADEHPLGDVRLGQAFMSDVANAFVNSPNYRRGAMFIIYDEWGGFFDHVRPPRVIDGRMNRDLDKDFGQLGFRTPAVALSPFARPKKRPKGFRVDHGTYAHESILKLISYRFRLGHLNKRHRYTRNIGRSFEWNDPDFERPKLPDAPQVASAPCSAGGAGVVDSQQAHANDLAGLEELAHRFDVPTYDGKTHQIFTKPHSLKRAYKKPKKRKKRRQPARG